MESSCVRQTLLPGTSRLFRDYLYNFDRVSRFYGHHFSDFDRFSDLARNIEYPDSRRAALVSALRKQNGDSSAISKLAEPGTVAVVTGQQVGLFSGPAYTLFKALTAVRLARQLSDAGISSVPIFWLATEDHDLAEVDHTWVFDHNARPTKLSVTSTTGVGGPVGQAELDGVPLEKLRDCLGELPFADEVTERIGHAYKCGRSLGRSFHDLLADLLDGFGLIFVDPLATEIRSIVAPFMGSVVGRVNELTDGLRQRDSELSAAGYHSQVLVDKQSSLLFLLGENERTAIQRKNGHFVTKDGSWTAAELDSRADQLSPNALLRPVMQDYLLPTISYIAGPAETAYLAQSQVLYEKLLGRMPIIFPRNSFTLLDARSTKLLHRYGLHVPDLLDHNENVRTRIAGRLVPEDLTQELANVRAGVTSSLAGLESSLTEFDRTLGDAAKKSAAKMLYQVDKLARKTARRAMQLNERATRDADYLIDLIYPYRHLQERFYSIVPFLAKHGLDLPARLMNQVQVSCPDHMVREV